MTAPAIRFPDPQRATRDALRALLPLYTLDATVSMSRPDMAEGVPLPRPHIRVRSGAPIRTSRVSATADVRLTVFADDEGAAMALAADVEAIALAELSSDSLLGFGAISGPVPGTDTDTGRPIALVTLSARLRPHHLPRKD
ncbi:tail terminator [Microbacterium phage Floof]|uniref:Tail terminator n=1 Tax=Microbacterium phage Floof TaxID=2201433 RepID=A0A2Z4Q5L2_9CAUD|nr:tail terminator [Microbacterium phage Floof]